MANATTPVIQINEGNVGIGTASPSAKLHSVITSNGFNPSLTYNTSAAAIVENWGVQLAMGVDTVNSQTFYLQARQSANASWPMSLNPLGGNVGIGTPSPATKLDVDGVVTASEFSADVNNVSALRMKSTASTIGYGVTNADLVSWSLGGVHPSGYYFRTTGANPAMQIIANGNVGIGTTSPTTTLEVIGDIKIKQNSIFSNYSLIDASEALLT